MNVDTLDAQHNKVNLCLFILNIIFHFKAQINNSSNNKTHHKTPSAHARLTQHRGNVVWTIWKTPSGAVFPQGHAPMQNSSVLWLLNQLCVQKSCAVNISAGLFYIALGIELRGGKIPYACGMSSDLHSFTLNHMLCLLAVPLRQCHIQRWWVGEVYGMRCLLCCSAPSITSYMIPQYC